ncbi:MAG TPA: ROK family protein [Candidatus Limnocylindrales bacterium]|nr:ROK family protein [Candidatus Limnocylindrales bacterium]
MTEPEAPVATTATATPSAAAPDPIVADPRHIAIGVDVGGSGIKVGVVDVARGQLLAPRLRVKTPDPSVPAAVVQAIARTVRRAVRGVGDIVPADAPIGVGVPCVVIDGVTKSAANIDEGWIDFDARSAIVDALKRPTVVLNDADAAGLAEMRFGAGFGAQGVVFVLTLGTGVGSGLFNDGVLVPNTELGHMEIRGRDAERRSAAAARVRRGLSWKAWASDLEEHLQAIDKLFSPNLIILGGGVSKQPERFIPRLNVRPQILPAQLRNDAGIVGAAMAAAEATRGS